MEPSREPDWSREHKTPFAWDPSKSLIASIRAYQRARARTGLIADVQRRWAIVRHRFWSAVTGAEIPLQTSIGGGLLIPHPNGIVVHPAAVIGANCMLFQQVTIGGGRGGTPTIGTGVDLGAGAKVFGGVTIGDFARIGANTVVACDIPAYTVVKPPAIEMIKREPPGSQSTAATSQVAS